MLITLKQCPVCKSSNLKEVFKAKDYTVSQELFSVQHCNECSHRFTSPVPDQTSIGPYYKSENYISHTNTKRGFISSVYQMVRKWTMKSKRNLVATRVGKEKGDLLDIGSGAGAFLWTMKMAGWNVLGLEPDPDAREVAKRDFGVEAKQIEMLMELDAEKYDAVTMWHVLEHVHELDAYIQQIKKILRPGGKWFVAVPNYTSWDAEHYGASWAAYDVPRHLYHFSPASIERMLEINGLKLLEIKRMPYDSFYVSLLTERYRGGGVMAAFWNGFRSYLAALGDKKRCSSLIYVIGK